MDPPVCGNRFSVRRYYAKNRKAVIKSKTMNACRALGRVPRVTTIQQYDLPIVELLEAFKGWQGHLPPSDPLRVKRTRKMNAVLAECLRV